MSKVTLKVFPIFQITPNDKRDKKKNGDIVLILDWFLRGKKISKPEVGNNCYSNNKVSKKSSINME